MSVHPADMCYRNIPGRFPDLVFGIEAFPSFSLMKKHHNQ